MNLRKSERHSRWNRNQRTCCDFRFPLDFFGVLLTGSALIQMVQTPKELALLGGSFLIGLGALEVCLRFGGFWHNTKVRLVTDNDARVCHCLRVNSTRMTFLMHWSFKTGYHEIAAKKFLATGAPFPECKSWKRFHAPGSVEGWILVEADTADACYEHAAEWAECLDWEVTPVLTDDQAGPLMAKAYSWSSLHQNEASLNRASHFGWLCWTSAP